MAPAFAALTCGGLIFVTRRGRLRPAEATLKKVFTVCLAAAAISWFTLFASGRSPEAFVRTGALFYCAILLTQVSFSHLFFILTRTDFRERFSPLHYAAPVLIGVALQVWSFSITSGVWGGIDGGTGGYVRGGYGAHALLFSSMICAALLFGIAYAAFAIVRIRRYYGVASLIHGFAGFTRKWAAGMSALCLITPAGSAGMLLSITGRDGVAWVAAIAAVMTVCQYLILTYYIMRRRFPPHTVLADEVGEPDYMARAERRKEPEKGSAALTRRRFEAYMKRDKPYLDPGFRLSDVVEKLSVNRSYVSAFINETYGVNFTRHMNRLRLREYRRLSKLSSSAGKKPRELAVSAGFVDTKHYLRAVRAEQEAATGDSGRTTMDKTGEK